MKNQKMKLNQLKVKSFTTTETKVISGGASGNCPPMPSTPYWCTTTINYSKKCPKQ
ncbi:MAG: pinensin family lanthipeptide [Bacteroidota bacterium]